ncbi:hypothetical protein E1091_11180 [Micromonospora fluostatini]|uniref:Uncharacterized protein n=1 Tax=Micromonospora fluostatini TaxID=1629071 RepID=A0ABY2DIY3_9ACTN|nr:hypothetical protein E1091_11180 [Micromonospora fluostatini]
MSGNPLELLLQELRGAVSARISVGADPDEMSAELARRLRRIRRMQEDHHHRPPDPPHHDR